jgi:hypothetical protein
LSSTSDAPLSEIATEAIQQTRGGGAFHMSIEVLAFAFGIVLLFVAIVGGGFELRELKVPKVGRIARVVSGIAAVIFLLIGFGATSVADTGPAAPPATTSVENGGQTTSTPIDFTVRDELGDGQLTEQITVNIDGRMVGTLTVDAVHPDATVTVTVPKPGQYDYSLDSRSTFDLDSGPTEIPGHGAGTINVREGASFSVVYDVGQDDLVLSLQ